jgi:hypothetical protein
VLESEITKGKEGYFLEDAKKRIIDLKKQIEWEKVDVLGNYEVNLYILSKHPEIISKEDYRKFLRQSVEKIKKGVSKVEEAVKQDNHGLEITTGEYGKSIWYPNTEAEKKEMSDHYDLPKEKRKGTNYENKLEYAEKFTDSLFKIDSPKYVGIPKHEFETSNKLLEYIEKLLNEKEVSPNKKEIDGEKNLKTKGYIISVLLTLFLSWVISWFVDINPFLIFIIVQVVAFAQSIIGGWLGKFFE